MRGGLKGTESDEWRNTPSKVEGDNGRFRCSFVKDDGKKVRKYAIPIVTAARKPTIYLEEVKEWQDSRKRRARLGEEN
ncbi:MAG: hypothetical protein ABSH06_25535 [Thermodesulfobacteriota bacterium]|jgi:hypothetical protein